MSKASDPPFAHSEVLPNFLVVGAMRAGTTTLYQALRSHPSIFMASVKETNFFVFVDGQLDLPLTRESARVFVSNSVTTPNEYLDLFRGAREAKAIGEVSPSYLFSPGAAARIRHSLPHARIIILLRDPVDRAYSAYLRRAGASPDPHAFLRIAEEEHRKYEEGQRLTHYPLIAGSLYSRLLSPYLEQFSPSRMFIRIFESFWNTPQRSMGELYGFLGLEPILSGIAHLNRSGIPRYKTVDAALRKGTGLKTFVKTRFPPPAVRSLVNLKQRIEDWTLKGPEKLPSHIRSRLVGRYFDQDISVIEQLLDVDLEKWRRH